MSLSVPLLNKNTTNSTTPVSEIRKKETDHSVRFNGKVYTYRGTFTPEEGDTFLIVQKEEINVLAENQNQFLVRKIERISVDHLGKRVDNWGKKDVIMYESNRVWVPKEHCPTKLDFIQVLEDNNTYMTIFTPFSPIKRYGKKPPTCVIL